MGERQGLFVADLTATLTGPQGPTMTHESETMPPAVTGPVEPTVMQHTPGPWVADKVTPRILDGEPYWRVGVVGGTCLYVGCGDEHEEADAHLIAAAPDLLSALRDLEAMAERYRQPGAPIPDAQKKARAAIAKAVGRAA